MTVTNDKMFNVSFVNEGDHIMVILTPTNHHRRHLERGLAELIAEVKENGMPDWLTEAMAQWRKENPE